MKAPLVIRAGQGSRRWVLGDHYTMMLGAAQTGGAFALGQTCAFPGGGPPPHVHHREDELFFVLEGRMRFALADAITDEVGPGFAIALPRGVVHQFRVLPPSRARFLVLTVPAGFEAFMDEAGIPTDETDPHAPMPPAPADVARVMGLVARHGIEVLPQTPEPTRALALAPGRRRWVLGEHVAFRLASADTGGSFCAVEITSPPGGGPPPHLHVREDELFHVLEGTYEFLLDDRTETCGPGDTVFVPAGALHTYRNVTPGRGRLLDLHTPGSFEAFFDELGTDAADGSSPPPPPDPSRVAEVIHRHGMRLAAQ